MRLIFSGLGLLWKVTPERSLCLQAMLGNLVIYPLFAVILPVLVKEQLQMPAWALGLAGACFGVGALVSSTWIAKPVISKMGRYSAVLTARVITIVGLGFATACFALGSSPESTLWLTGALPGLVGAGIGFSVLNIAVSQARAIATPDALRNRLLTAAAAIVTLAIPLGSASAGWLLAHVAPVGVLVAVVLVLAVATLLLWADAPTRSLLETPDAQLPAAYGTYLRDEGVAVRPAAS
jgi:MFS family permease